MNKRQARLRALEICASHLATDIRLYENTTLYDPKTGGPVAPEDMVRIRTELLRIVSTLDWQAMRLKGY